MKLTIVSTQRPNVAPFDMLQRNALGSWQPIADEIVFCRVIGRPSHYVGTSGHGHAVEVPGAGDLPSVVGMLNAGLRSGADVIALTNADIIMTYSVRVAAEFLHARFRGRPFCASMRRYDIDARHELPWSTFTQTAKYEVITQRYLTQADVVLHRPDGMDVFLVSRTWDWSMMHRDLVVGAPAWDNRLAALAIARGLFIDLTPVAVIMHQNHTRNYDVALTARNRTVGRVARGTGRSLAHCTHRVIRHAGRLDLRRARPAKMAKAKPR